MSEGTLSRGAQWSMAVGCAVTVGNIYFLQPLLAQLAHDFRISDAQASSAAMLSSLGYAAGMFAIVPLGDFFERRRMILWSLVASFLVLLILAFAPSFAVMCVASFALGVATCTPQLIVPMAAHLATPTERGRVVGFVMSGLLLGILLARTISGQIGGAFGWRAVYLFAAVMAVVMFLLLMRLPQSPPSTQRIPYRQLLKSLWQLLREEPVLVESSLYGALLFGCFMAFWTSLTFHLSRTPFDLNEKQIGLFGLVGAAGALAAPVAGRLADQGGPRRTIFIGILLTLLSFGVYLLPSVAAIVIGVLLMDIGVQASHISNQSRIYGRRPESRNRMNTVYMTTYFVGGSLGTALGSHAWSGYGWIGVCSLGAILSLLALAVFWLTRYSSGRVA